MAPVALAGARFAQASPITQACGARGQRSWLCSTTFDLSNNQRAAEIADLFSKPVRIAIILFAAWLFARLARRLLRRMVRPLTTNGNRIATLKQKAGFGLVDTSTEPSPRRAQRAETLGNVLGSIATGVIWAIAIMMVLGDLGINLAPLLAGAGVAGVALGFGAQSLVRDFLAGFFMLVEDQFGVGDVIDVGDATGTVEGVSLRTTRLRDVEGVVWHVPNGEIKRVGNKSQQWSRAVLDIGVAYETDIPTATRVIKETADELYRDPAWGGVILGEPEVWGVEDLGVSSVVIRLVVKTRPLEQWRVARELRARIKVAFDAAGIDIPFPQQTVTYRQDAPPPVAGGSPPDGDGERRQ